MSILKQLLIMINAAVNVTFSPAVTQRMKSILHDQSE